MKYTLLVIPMFAMLLFTHTPEIATKKQITDEKPDYPQAEVSFSDFKEILLEVESIRENYLLSYEKWLAMSTETNTIILDTRSAELFQGKHIKGAVNLPYTEFTQASLKKVIPNLNTRILIYCNNNFYGDPSYFPLKSSAPMVANPNFSFSTNQKPRMLALNIPTYITLHGYGYNNIYELDELLSVKDKRVELEVNASTGSFIRGRRNTDYYIDGIKVRKPSAKN